MVLFLFDFYDVVCLYVIYGSTHVGRFSSVTSGISLTGVVSPQAVSQVIDDAYQNLTTKKQGANNQSKQEADLLHHQHPSLLLHL